MHIERAEGPGAKRLNLFTRAAAVEEPVRVNDVALALALAWAWA